MTTMSIAKEIPMSDNELELSQGDFMMKGIDQYGSNVAIFLKWGGRNHRYINFECYELNSNEGIVTYPDDHYDNFESALVSV